MKRNIILPLLILFALLHKLKSNENYNSIEQLKHRRLTELTADSVMESYIDSMLNEMTIKEKIGQMIQIAVDVFAEITPHESSQTGITEINLDTKRFIPFVKEYPIGSILNGYGFSPENWIAFEESLQKANEKYSRLKIPILHGADHQHGANYVHGATIFPHSLNMASTFNRDLVYTESKITGIETADLGHRWIFGPIADLGCNPGWPRIYETYGEDPFLASEMVNAYLQARNDTTEIGPYKQVSCVKHFIGYSDPEGIWDRTPADISWQTLWDLHIPPFKQAIESGVDAVMLNSGEVNGQAIHGSYQFVTKLLRDDLNFKGVVITDWDDINKLWKYHRIAPNAKEATLAALNAGIDITMAPYNLEFGMFTEELLNEGRISIERIDLSVARILRLKYKSGVLEYPYPSGKRLHKIGSKDHQDIALNAARESIILLKNNKLLPLEKTKGAVLITGPFAHSKKALAGGWTYRWYPESDDIFPKDMQTVYSGLKEVLSGKSVELVEHVSSVLESNKSDVESIIVVLGEDVHTEGLGNINDILLPEDQKEILTNVLQTNIPVILVLVGARPLIATELYDQCETIIWAGLPGIHGGQAIAEIISGVINPSGKLSFSFPAHAGHYYTYNHKPSHTNYDIPPQNNRVIFAPFGYGLSYSSIVYSDLILSDTVLKGDASIKATITITNHSDIPAKESVLWYISDEVASITPRVKALKGFEKIFLSAGASDRLNFEISLDQVSFRDDKGQQILEPGYFTLFVGDLEKRFKLVLK